MAYFQPFEVGIEVGAEDVSVEVTEKENIVQVTICLPACVTRVLVYFSIIVPL